MINFTPLVRPYFRNIYRKEGLIQSRDDIRQIQLSWLNHHLRKAADTAVGRKYNFDDINTYEQFSQTLPTVQYEDIRTDVMSMIEGQPDILWPGTCTSYAQSSGTSGGKSKYIPVTADSLALNHYTGGAFAIAAYLNLYKQSNLFGGKSFILGGSFANELKHIPAGVRVGDVSASLIANINPLVNIVRVPSRKVALMSDWTEKLPALVNAAQDQNITNISGVPSWFLGVLKAILDSKGVHSIHQVWPKLEVFFHGGIAFDPYREQYAAISDPGRLRYIENYNSSEGFFAVQDTKDTRNVMRLLLNAGIFYEFIPLSELDKPSPKAIPAWDVEQGRTYALVITAPNGLWRYILGDTVRIESVTPLRISIAGRITSFINAFGEEVMECNTNAAIAAACSQTGAAIANYTVAPVFTSVAGKAHHQWLIEWTTPPKDLKEFAAILDRELQSVNSDYQAKRSGDIFLAPLEIVSLPTGTFDSWLASTGKLGGQRKIPRLANDRRIADAILQMGQ